MVFYDRATTKVIQPVILSLLLCPLKQDVYQTLSEVTRQTLYATIFHIDNEIQKLFCR